eukprot:gnl/TRDRNA2_/TRDRNA2_40342_c0_seq1.p1 gnl/TRDRNA2_/TRDRNA2_40342_c0~~gnl/TRDRNA2_/TRDRNA2_40342_c0_seq1.p1  ORF type:complete len:624 (+),score=93.63 gnl/TRDRNA2_/TRDRNA2_40342_c0_seq1:55-1926(+)
MQRTELFERRNVPATLMAPSCNSSAHAVPARSASAPSLCRGLTPGTSIRASSKSVTSSHVINLCHSSKLRDSVAQCVGDTSSSQKQSTTEAVLRRSTGRSGGRIASGDLVELVSSGDSLASAIPKRGWGSRSSFSSSSLKLLASGSPMQLGSSTCVSSFRIASLTDGGTACPVQQLRSPSALLRRRIAETSPTASPGPQVQLQSSASNSSRRKHRRISDNHAAEHFPSGQQARDKGLRGRREVAGKSLREAFAEAASGCQVQEKCLHTLDVAPPGKCLGFREVPVTVNREMEDFSPGVLPLAVMHDHMGDVSINNEQPEGDEEAQCHEQDVCCERLNEMKNEADGCPYKAADELPLQQEVESVADTDYCSDTSSEVAADSPPQQKGESFAEAYYRSESADLMVFISGDSSLQALHRSFEAMLVGLEEHTLSSESAEVFRSMTRTVPSSHVAGAEKHLFWAALADVDVFLSVALSLLEGERPSGMYLTRTERAISDVMSFTQSKSVLVVRALGSDCGTSMSRGRERSLLLRRFFRCVFWLGRTDMPNSGSGDGIIDAAEVQLIPSLVTLEQAQQSGSIELLSVFEYLVGCFLTWVKAAVPDSRAFLRLAKRHLCRLRLDLNKIL